jgi:hypothetical protein
MFCFAVTVLLVGQIFAAMTNLSELPVASEARNVIAKQLDAGFYRASPYTVAACSMHVPVTLVESLCYSTLFYWLAGLEADGGRFLFPPAALCPGIQLHGGHVPTHLLRYAQSGYRTTTRFAVW